MTRTDTIGKDPFGRTVAINGHTVIVGVPGVTDFSNAGTTYFYQLEMD